MEEPTFEDDFAMTWRLSPRVKAALNSRRIGLRPAGLPEFSQIVFPKNIAVEAYSSFPGHPQFFELGAFSYAETDRDMNRVRVGRYTSIGSDVEIFGERHPSEWVTQSMITYDFGYPGIAAAHEDFGGCLPEPASVANRHGQPITIGHDVWIGRHVQLARGISIGNGAAIGAGAVVTKDVAPYMVVGGVPARPIKQRFPDPLVEALLASEWWDYSPTILWELGFKEPDTFCRRLKDRKESSSLARFHPISTTAYDLKSIILGSP